MVEYSVPIQVRLGGKVLKKMQIDWLTPNLRLLQILLAATLWTCHVWVAPTFRLFHRLAAATFGPHGLHMDKVSSPEFSARDLKTKHSEPQVHYSEQIVESQLGVAQIKSIPRFLVKGIKPSRGQKKVIENRPLNSLGVTLIELIAVMAIIGILAATVLPRLNIDISSSTSVNGAAYMIASDIRYTQEFAMANRASKSIQFSTAAPANKYTFAPVSAGMDPSGQLSGATIGTTVTFTFNSLGEPTTTAGWTVTVSAGGVSKTITVVNYTGKVNIS